jgi:hypothetical protein
MNEFRVENSRFYVLFLFLVVFILSIYDNKCDIVVFSILKNQEFVKKLDHDSNLNKTIIVRISNCKFIYFTKKSNGMGTNMKSMVTQSL